MRPFVLLLGLLLLKEKNSTLARNTNAESTEQDSIAAWDKFCKLEGLPAAGLKPELLRPFRWVHVPKTGTSFASTLFHYACRNVSDDSHVHLNTAHSRGMVAQRYEQAINAKENCDDDWFVEPRVGHRAFYVTQIKRTPGLRAVAMLRDPRRRLLSAYVHYYHSDGMGPELRKQLVASKPTFEDYVNFPGIRGCMTKVLLGSRCARDINITQAQVDEAIRRLRYYFAFVGITDQWNDSICLFHSMFGGVPKSFFFKNVRPASLHVSHQQRLGPLPEYTDLPTDLDPYDWQIYQEAVRIFDLNRARYGLPVYKERDNDA